MSSGNHVGYLADGLSSGWNYLGGFSAGWKVEGCADFDGNGKSDILFSNSDGTQIGYYVDGLPSGWNYLGGVAPGWDIVIA